MKKLMDFFRWLKTEIAFMRQKRKLKKSKNEDDPYIYR